MSLFSCLINKRLFLQEKATFETLGQGALTLVPLLKAVLTP
jgi:hypothetical protein